jgi:hypothetical protein
MSWRPSRRGRRSYDRAGSVAARSAPPTEAMGVGGLLCSPIAVALNRWALVQDERPDVVRLS